MIAIAILDSSNKDVVTTMQGIKTMNNVTTPVRTVIESGLDVELKNFTERADSIVPVIEWKVDGIIFIFTVFGDADNNLYIEEIPNYSKIQGGDMNSINNTNILCNRNSLKFKLDKHESVSNHPTIKMDS